MGVYFAVPLFGETTAKRQPAVSIVPLFIQLSSQIHEQSVAGNFWRPCHLEHVSSYPENFDRWKSSCTSRLLCFHTSTYYPNSFLYSVFQTGSWWKPNLRAKAPPRKRKILSKGLPPKSFESSPPLPQQLPSKTKDNRSYNSPLTQPL